MTAASVQRLPTLQISVSAAAVVTVTPISSAVSFQAPGLGLAKSYRDSAANDAAASETSRIAAETAETGAQTAEAGSLVNAGNAADSATEAQEWANHPEDVLVPSGDLVDDYSALHHRNKAAASAAAAFASEQAANADAIQTAADRVQTGLDVTQTTTDRAQTGLDAAATAADALATAADAVQTAADRVQTGLDKTATNADASATAADRVQTGLDKTATNADAVSTDAAKVAAQAAQAAVEALFDTFDDRFLGTKASAPVLDNDGNALLVGACYYDSVALKIYFYNGAAWVSPEQVAGDAAAAASASETAAGNSATAAAASEAATDADAIQTAADRVQTGLDKAATNADAIATAADRVQTGLDAASALASKNAAQTAETNAGNSATAAQAAEASALALYDAFDDRFLGDKAADPALDNDGNALLEGALYWNTTTKALMIYNGSAWEATGHTHTNKAVLDATTESFTTVLLSNLNTAFGWGNHASAGYYPSSSMNATGVNFSSVLSTSFPIGIGRFYTDQGGSPTGSWVTGVTVKTGITRGFQFGMGHVETASFYFRNQATDGTAWGTWYRVWSNADFNAGDKNNWNTAYGWGNHASAGYLLSSALPTLGSNVSTSSKVQAGRSGGGIVLNVNDGYGNANVCFNHDAGTPEQNGNSGRIQCNTDATSNAQIIIGVKSNVTQGVAADVTDILTVLESGITVTGSVTATGDGSFNSDERLKTDWNDLPADFIYQFAEVKHGSYTRIDEGMEGVQQVGVSAQSLREVLPLAVREDETGVLSVTYGNAAMVAAIQLAKKVVELEKRIIELEAK